MQPPPVWRGTTTRRFEPADVACPNTLASSAIDPHFLALHESFLARGKAGDIDLLFLGDSITELWLTTGQAVWNKNYSQYHAADFGISGDRTQHLLWRIENGELAGIHPKVVVVLIGTNNTDYPAAEIIRADEKIVREIHENLPKSKLLLLGIFPRECFADDPVRLKIQAVNAELAKQDNGRQIRFLNIGGRFIMSDGKINMPLMPDFLHPSAAGYQVWADAMRPLLLEMMNAK